jgi:hypothetical protein
MELVPILAITSLGILGFCLMLAAFVGAARSPRFPDLPPGAQPRWPRRLMLAGATLGAAFGLLMLLPGVLPWLNSGSEYADLLWGAAGGAAIGGITLHAVRSASRRSGCSSGSPR